MTCGGGTKKPNVEKKKKETKCDFIICIKFKVIAYAFYPCMLNYKKIIFK